jgi:hypothetical protein
VWGRSIPVHDEKSEQGGDIPPDFANPIPTARLHIYGGTWLLSSADLKKTGLEVVQEVNLIGGIPEFVHGLLLLHQFRQATQDPYVPGRVGLRSQDQEHHIDRAHYRIAEWYLAA